MTSTTTLKLPDELKLRVAEAAESAGKSPHAFMLEAQTRLAERRREFIGSALAAEQEAAQFGLVHDGDEVLSYLQSLLDGRAVRRPRPRKAWRPRVVPVPKLQFAPRALDDLDRLAAFLIETSPALAAETAPLIIGALRSLRDHPLIGRPVEEGLRELLISRGRTGYVALYRYNPVADRVLVLRVRHQRELGTD